MIKPVTGRAVHRRRRQRHTTDRAWLHRLITKWAKKVNTDLKSFGSCHIKCFYRHNKIGCRGSEIIWHFGKYIQDILSVTVHTMHTSLIEQLLKVHLLGTFLYMCARSEVSIIKSVARRTVHRLCQRRRQRRQNTRPIYDFCKCQMIQLDKGYFKVYLLHFGLFIGKWDVGLSVKNIFQGYHFSATTKFHDFSQISMYNLIFL